MRRAKGEDLPMVIPMDIRFRHMARSAAVEEVVRRRGDKLDQLYPRVTSCRVLIEALHRMPRLRGVVHHVRVDITVPGGELVARREPPHLHFHEDVFVAVRDAFDSVCRELQDYARLRRGDVKVHEPRPHGRVVRLFLDRGYGFVESDEGYDVYFHEHAVADGGFRRLDVGAEVLFDEEEGVRGPQASTVVVVSRARPGE
jgi:cold shock CspA family protein